MTKIYQSIYDPPILLDDYDTLQDVHIIRGGSSYGHVIFQHGPVLEIVGHHILVRDCIIEMM